MKTTFQLDDVTIQREADGTVTIQSKKGGGCITIGLLITTALITLCGGAMAVEGVLQLFDPQSESAFQLIVFGLFVSVMFGSFAYFQFNKTRAGLKRAPVIISPITNTIKIGERVIPFSEVADVLADANPSGVFKMKGVAVARFGLELTKGEIVELGSLAAEKNNIDQRESEILEF